MDVAQIAIHQPYDHIKKTSGKQLRSKLIKAFNSWLDVDPKYVQLIEEVVEILHNASLLIDDIEDDSVLRRGQPVAHLVYGIPITINSANYYYFVALNKLVQHFPSDKVHKVVQIYSEQMLRLHEGQGMDIYWRDAQQCPSIEQYKAMINLKTTSLFYFSYELLNLFSNKKMELKPLCTLLGDYFQIRDDYANLKLAEYAENKSYCEDFTEGKFSFPVIHAITTSPDDLSIRSILSQRTKKIELKKFAVDKLQDLGSFDFTYQELKRLYDEIKDEIKRLGGNKLFDDALEVIGLPQKGQIQNV